MEYMKKIILSDPKRYKIFNEIMDKNEMYWRKFSGPDEIFKWLQNFQGDEIDLALVLANNILYYTQEYIRYLWKLILANRVKQFLLGEIFGSGTLPDLEKWFPEYLREKCVFIGYGRAGKSGPSMVSSFRQSQDIKDLRCLELSEFLYGSEDFGTKERVFLLDDFVGSGDQAQRTWRNKINGKSFSDVHEKNPHLEFIYLALAGVKEGREKIEMNTPMKVIIGEELDERFKCFSTVSVIYENPHERTRAKQVMEAKGRILYPEYPLGYANMELAVAFCHNTPNNSLPVIWKRMRDGSWYPLFERFE